MVCPYVQLAIPHAHLVPWGPEEGVGYLETGGVGICETPCG